MSHLISFYIISLKKTILTKFLQSRICLYLLWTLKFEVMKYIALCFLTCTFVSLNAQQFIEVFPHILDDSGVATSQAMGLSDIDLDGDIDILVTGNRFGAPYEFDEIAKLYLNDGDGNFTIKTNNSIGPVRNSAVSFSDVDNDGDEDVLVLGINTLGNSTTDLYLNNGTGVFLRQFPSTFLPVDDGVIAFSDIDGDGDEDVLITAYLSTELYENDGDGVFTRIENSNLLGVSDSDAAFSDIDGDNDMDFLLHGRLPGFGNITIFYENDGLGNYKENIDTQLVHGNYGSVAFADIDQDGDDDLLITSNLDNSTFISYLYINDGQGNFTKHQELEGLRTGTTSFADVDNDNDLDLFMCGSGHMSSKETHFYLNDGDGNFIENTESNFEGFSGASLGFVDVDNDQDLDLLLNSYSQDFYVLRLFKNNLTTTSVEATINNSNYLDIISNPISRDMMRIRFNSNRNALHKFLIYDEQGQLALQSSQNMQVGENQKEIDISMLSNGIYFIQLEEKGNSISQKFVISR